MAKAKGEEIYKLWMKNRSALTEKETFVLKQYYGLGEDSVHHTLAEIGTLMDVSRERVRQIKAQAIDKIEE